jgi:ADP-ribosylglycohydrolase
MSRQAEAARRDRIAGTLLGMAAGDALGSQYEGRTPPLLGTATFGHGTYGHEPAEWTDDTQQAVIVAQSRSDPLKVARGLIAWHHGHPRDEGITTAAVLSRAREPADLAGVSRQAGKGRPPGSVSNGSLMRTGPVCLPYLGNRRKIAATAREISDLTHYDAYAGDACVLWSLLIEAAIAHGPAFTLGSEVARAITALPAARRQWWQERCLTAIKSAPGAYKSNSKAVDAFSAALSAVAHSVSLEDGLQIAVAIGGDTDTVAAIAGALLGAIHGASAVPRIWRSQLTGWPGLDATGLERLALEAAGIA